MECKKISIAALVGAFGLLVSDHANAMAFSLGPNSYPIVCKFVQVPELVPPQYKWEDPRGRIVFHWEFRCGADTVDSPLPLNP